MRISELSIKRPVTTLMVVFVVLILGFVSFTRLNVDLLPSINLPIAVVSTAYQGAGPEEVEGIVTKNLEAVLATVNNVESVQSISSEGNSLIILEFTQDTDMDFAALDIREKLDLIQGRLPEGVSDPMVLKLDPNMMPIMNFGISQEGRDVTQLKDWVEDVLKPRIERIEGVAAVNITGGPDREIKVIVDPKKLISNGLTMNNIVNALRMENINAPGGIVTDGKYDLLVRTVGEFQSIEDIRNLPVTAPTGTTLFMKDLAVIEEGLKDDPTFSKINGQDSLMISVQKESISNTVKVAEKVNKEIATIQEQNPGFHIVTVLDQSVFINRSISSVANNGMIGGLLAVIILLLFLKNLKPTLVIATSIPISVIATFIMVYFSNITLNMISLGGLALGVGMLVDNSIVVLENIYRLRQEGLGATEAAMKGSSQVTMAILASTLTTICVFLPIVFIQGITAEIFRQMALTVTFSLLASLAVALTFVPMLSSKLLRGEHFNKRSKTLDRIDALYRRWLFWALSHRKTVIAVALIIFLASLAMISMVGTEFFPAVDEGQINITVNAPKGSTFEETQDILVRVEKAIADIPEIDTISSSIGGRMISANLSGGSQDSGNITILLKRLNERERSTQEIGNEIRKKVANIAGCEIHVDARGSMLGRGMSGSWAGSSISISVRGESLETLSKISEDLVDIVSKVEGATEVKSSYEGGSPEMRIVLDRSRASQYGVNVAMVSAAIQSELQGTVATRYKVGGKEIDIRVQTPYEKELDIQAIRNMDIPTTTGTMVPLNSIADFISGKSPVSINRQDQSRVVTVTGDLSDRPLGSVMKDIQAQVEEYPLPEGYLISYGGENELLQEAFDDLIMALVLGVVLVYMVMASQFESLVHPFTIMFSIPLAFTGAFLSLLLVGIPLSVPAFVGLIILAGVVVNNGIVLVDYINVLRSEGLERNEAILQTGPTRLRPILMTTLTTVLGLLPLALGIGEGAELEMPLAVSVIGGLSLSTLLTLVVVPVIYSLLDDLGNFFKSKKDAEII
jgi:HAE1 family hydrophobic/amphiphilic exporter-1